MMTNIPHPTRPFVSFLNSGGRLETYIGHVWIGGFIEGPQADGRKGISGGTDSKRLYPLQEAPVKKPTGPPLTLPLPLPTSLGRGVVNGMELPAADVPWPIQAGTQICKNKYRDF